MQRVLVMGCSGSGKSTFARYTRTFEAQQKPKMLAYFASLRPEQRFVTFTTRAQANDFLARAEAA